MNIFSNNSLRDRMKPSAGVAAAVTVIGGTLVVGGQPVSAVTFVVTDAGDSGPGTLRDAILSANFTPGADTITFAQALAGSTITLTSGVLDVSDDLTIAGPGQADLTLTTTAGDILYLYNGASLAMSDITLTGAMNDAVQTYNSGDLTLSSVTITASQQDAVRFVSPGADLTIVSSNLDGNFDDGVSVGSADDVTMIDSTSRFNDDAGLYFTGNATGSIVVTRTNLSGNYYAGLVFEGVAGSVTVTDSTIDNNGLEGVDGATYVDGDVSITGSSVDGNGFYSGSDDGLNLYVVHGNVTLTSTSFDSNAQDGVEIDTVDQALTVTTSTISQNGAHGLRVDDTVAGTTSINQSSLDGNAVDGFYANNLVGDVALTTSSFDGNADDGVDLASLGGALAIAGSSVSDNTSDGVYLQDVRGTGLTLSASTIGGNGDQGLTVDDGVYGDVAVSDSFFQNNGDSGFYVYNVSGDVIVSGTTATDNGNNGLYLERIGGNVDITSSLLSRNGDTGAEIEPVVGNVTVTDTVFEGNQRSGLYIRDNIGGNVTIERVTATDNDGPGLYVSDVQGTVTISDSTSTGSNDNGIDLEDNVGVVTIQRSTVAGSADNAIDSFGAGAELRIVNSTLTGNGDAVSDAVIDSDLASPIKVAHSTIAGNGVAGMTAPVIEVDDAVVAVDHTVITDNNGAGVFGASGTGSVAVTNSLTPVGSALGVSNIESNVPLLGPLADNGGLTDTLFPLAGSPVIDAGDPAIVGAPATDQRGGPRQIGTIDIGSVEVNAGSVSVADVTVAEDAGPATLSVTRSGGSDGAASVQVSTVNGTALAGQDYTAVTQTVAWADGESGAKTVLVPIINDAEVESTETFGVVLGNASVVSIADGSGTVTITDDDSVAVGAVTSLDPSRYVDTRSTGATFDDRFEAEGKRAAGSEYRVQIAGRGGVPVGARAAVINVTAVAPEAKGFVTVHPCVTPRPNASSLNYTLDVNLANEIVAPLSATGELCIYTSETAHIVVDVTGFVDAGSATTPVTPARYLDTRAIGSTFDQGAQRGGRTTAGGQVTLKVAGRGAVPADAVAVIANVTAVNPDGKGFVTVHPCAATPPNASSLNYVDGINRANELIASVNSRGEICLFTSTATDLLVDIVGFIPAGTSFNPIAPARFLDTRAAGDTVDDVSQREGKRTANSQYVLQIAGRPGVPVGTSAVVVNVTAVAPEAKGFVTVHPCEATRPNASSLNYVVGVDGANELIARLDATGKICLYTDQNTHLVVDVVGYLD